MKKAAIMQPYFFPYLGYFNLIKHSDMFVLFDTAQFIYHGWIERNRILRPGEGWQYIRCELEKHSNRDHINHIAIKKDTRWQNKILAQLQHYKRYAPYYQNVIDLLKGIFSIQYETIAALNEAALKSVCDYLGINTPIQSLSTMDINISANEPDEWALNICLALGDVDTYINPPGGLAFFDRRKYINAGINIEFYKIILQEYDQRRMVFEPGLSIIDVLMFNAPEVICEMLDVYEVL